MQQLLRFLFSGAVAVSVDFASFVLLRQAGVPLVAANVVAFSLAFLTGFTINRNWTFDAAGGNAPAQLGRYGIVALLGLGVNTAILAGLVGVGTDELLAKAAATAGSAAVNFLLSRRWVFV